MHFDLITVVADGWVELRLAGPGDHPRVLARVGERDGRRAVDAVMVAGGPLDSQALRSIPMARIESALNHPKFGMLNAKLAVDDDVLRSLADRGHLFPEEFAAIDAALGAYLEKAPQPSGETPGASHAWRRRRKPLTRPDGSNPDGFYRQVADAYNDLIVSTSAPAPILAEEASVPVPTVHRWIAEARRRGHLPPARRGRAG
ncbi:acyl-CoA carboxylase epsilon subunit [Micromonospora sp. WMMA1923]|uniref:acyl-CoA carboxylase epsilon subunit n=1 Tax=Micromonospora sp. WMMA1923 TaxID=3404125 RepID=UPI003B944476